MAAVLRRRLPEAVELVRYGAASLVALALDFATLVICTEVAGVPYLISAAAGFSLGVCVAYLLSISWVFTTRRYDQRGFELFAFAAIGAAGLIVNHVVIWEFTEIIGFDYRYSKMISIPLVFFFNFSVRKVLLFSPERHVARTFE